MKSSREQLKESAGEIRALEAIIKSNRTALQTAEQQAQQAEATLRGFDGLQTHIATWRASQIKRKLSPGRLPENLRTKQEAKAGAQEELALANETAAMLAEELREDEQKLARLKRATLPAAASVVHQEIIQPLAVEMILLNRRRHDLERQLRAWKGLTVLTDTGWTNLGSQTEVLAALNGYHGDSQEFIVGANPSEVQTSRYRDLVDRLISDPAAEIQAPALVKPEDFYTKQA
jgi:hypothetical protein